MENEEFVKQAAEYLDTLPLKKFTENFSGTTYWCLPEADASEWISCVSYDSIKVVTEVKIEMYTKHGPVIFTKHAYTVNDFVNFKVMMNSILKDCERIQRKFHSLFKDWKTVQIKNSAKNFEV